MTQAKWELKTNWFWTRIYLLPMVYVGRHVIDHIIEDMGPMWMFSVGWLFFEITISRCADSRQSRPAVTERESVASTD